MTKRSNPEHEPLSKRYPGEFNCWKGMRERLREQGLEVHPKFRSFDQFFAIMGPKPNPEDTLDRIDHTNPEYSPQNVRWASKSLQARNRKNTTYLRYTGEKYADKKGRELSLTEWAAVTGQNASTLRGRKKAGWLPNEIVEGQRAHEQKTFDQMSLRELLDYQPWDPDKASGQEASYRSDSKKHQDRFEFMLSVIQSVHFARLRKRYKSVAYFMPNESERDEYESRFGSFEKVVGDWGRKPKASRADWDQLHEDYAAHRAKYAKIAKQHVEWRKALKVADAAEQSGAAALRKRQELQERYTTPRRPKASPRFDENDD